VSNLSRPAFAPRRIMSTWRPEPCQNGAQPPSPVPKAPRWPGTAHEQPSLYRARRAEQGPNSSTIVAPPGKRESHQAITRAQSMWGPLGLPALPPRAHEERAVTGSPPGLLRAARRFRVPRIRGLAGPARNPSAVERPRPIPPLEQREIPPADRAAGKAMIMTNEAAHEHQSRRRQRQCRATSTSPTAPTRLFSRADNRRLTRSKLRHPRLPAETRCETRKNALRVGTRPA